MSTSVTTQRMTRPLLLIAAIVVVSAFALWGVERGVAALIGALLSVGNWFALRGLSARLVSANFASGARGAALGFLLIGKIGLLMAIVFILINRVRLDPIGLAFGLSVLFVGPVLAGLLTAGNGAAQSLDPSAALPAREER
ncbi:MAG: hypothetical protein JWN48_3172 [Myxococcaceae bacterium]|nr:hypothetical protein [Myxococcaceae bacterium]